MRWLFLFVFSLNLAYIGWQMNQSSSAEYDVPALKNVQPIVLLAELKQKQHDLPVSEPAETKAKVVTVDSAPVKKLPTKLVAAEVVEDKPQKLVDKPVVPVADSVPDKVVGIPPKVTESLDVAVPTMPGSSIASCFTLGPFRDLSKLRSLTRDIKSYVMKADFRGREETEQTLHWVYIKPEKSQKKAIATGKRLKAKKIKDFYVIRDGEKLNGLSLGHFRNKGGAYRLAKKVKSLGFDVIVEPVFKTYTIYWLDYQLDSGVVIPASIFEKHIKPGKKDKISRLSRDCGA